MPSVRFKGTDLKIIKTLGKGKSGHSYLVDYLGTMVVAKVIHHEPCSYYQFADKFQSELDAYERLRDVGVPVPELIDFDKEGETLIKEYIEGDLAIERVGQNKIDEQTFEELHRISELAKSYRINLDYFPANFVLTAREIFYVDYELNPYAQEWDLEHWGIYYWLNSSGIRDFLNSGNHLAINTSSESGKPRIEGLEESAQNLFRKLREK